jgi:hypothetical protein
MEPGADEPTLQQVRDLPRGTSQTKPNPTVVPGAESTLVSNVALAKPNLNVIWRKPNHTSIKPSSVVQASQPHVPGARERATVCRVP